jgi:nucleoside-diphosphate-sugar epimerase
MLYRYCGSLGAAASFGRLNPVESWQLRQLILNTASTRLAPHVETPRSMYAQSEKVVVTGGAGFIGSHLVDRLLADTAADVVVVDNFYRGRLTNLAQHADNRRLTIIEGDVRNSGLLDEVFSGAHTVFHLAGQSTVMGAVEDLEYSFTSNVNGTFNVLRAAARESIHRLVFASSREVYGEPIELPVDEGQPLHAINFYGASKVMGEAYCSAFRRAYGLNTVILRLANVYGPRDIGRVIPLWIEQACMGEDLTVYGGKQLVDFVWIGLVVEALMRTSRLDGPTPPINVGAGRGTRILDLATRICAATHSPSAIQVVPARAVEVMQYVACVDRMRELLGLEPPSDPLARLTELVPSASPDGAGRGHNHPSRWGFRAADSDMVTRARIYE